MSYYVLDIRMYFQIMLICCANTPPRLPTTYQFKGRTQIAKTLFDSMVFGTLPERYLTDIVILLSFLKYILDYV